MAEKTKLVVLGAFGPSRDQALFLAAHPEERSDEQGELRPNHRTLILSLKGDKLTCVDEQPFPLLAAWYSPTTGTAYCASVHTNKIYKWKSGKWSEEIFSDAPVDYPGHIFGLAATVAEDEQLFLSTNKGVFIRNKGNWKRHPLKRSSTPMQIHGRKFEEVYVGSEDPWRWDGKKLEELEAPEDDTTDSVWVTEDDRLLAGTHGLYLSNAKGDWEPLEVPASRIMMLLEHKGVIYAAAESGGLLRVFPGRPAVLKGKVTIDRLASLGDALVGIGEEVMLIGEGKTWKQIPIPTCEVGKRP
jgi:hypothetical protein